MDETLDGVTPVRRRSQSDRMEQGQYTEPFPLPQDEQPSWYDQAAQAQVGHPGNGDDLPPGDGDGGMAESDRDLIDEEWNKPARFNRLSKFLAVGIGCVAVFAVGAFIQRQYGGASASSPAGARSMQAGGGYSAMGGGYGGLGGMSGMSGGPQASAGAQGAASGMQAGSGAAGSSSTPVVVGTVSAVAQGKISVRNLAGSVVTVKISGSTTVTTKGIKTLAVGMTVSVSGSKSSNGTVTATAITVTS
jgi:hypothetical protein